MTTLVVFFILSIILVWGVLMYSIWRKQHHESEGLPELTPLYNKSSRVLRKLWFAVLRAIGVARAWMTRLATKAFFAIFPSARKAFLKKDELTGLEHGPSSYFLKSITPEKGELQTEGRKNRRKRKSV